MKNGAHPLETSIASVESLGHLALAAYDHGKNNKVFPWQFVRRAVYRPAFDEQTSLTLAHVVPERITDLDIMHPASPDGAGRWKVTPSHFEISGTEENPLDGRWMYSFNPYACHELWPEQIPQGASLHWIARNEKEDVLLQIKIRRIETQVWTITLSGYAGHTLLTESMGLWQPKGNGGFGETGQPGEAEREAGFADSMAGRSRRDRRIGADAFPRIILQGQGCGMTLYCQEGNRLPDVVLCVDFPDALDFRKVERCLNTQVWVGAIADKHAPVKLRSVRQFFSAGAGIADLRPVTTTEGLPVIEHNRVFVTVSLRGRGLPHPLQGVLSFDPALSDLRLEGVIVFDCGDGLWRNEIASHLIYEPATGDWLGLATGFSGYADTPRTEKQIRAFRTRRDPRFGFSVIKATPTGLIGDYEDPALIYDDKRKNWRLALCMNSGEGYKAALLEASNPAGPFRVVSGPVGPDATGMQILNCNGDRHVLFGSADRCLYAASYEDLKIEGRLSLDLPPWRDETGTRVWPTVIPLPEGSFAPAILVTMDRINYPGMPSPNWTYGAVYFYHAVNANIQP